MKRLKLLYNIGFDELKPYCSKLQFAGDCEVNLGMPIGQLRAVPLNMGNNQPRAVAAMYSEDAEIDPYIGMFFFSETYA